MIRMMLCDKILKTDLPFFAKVADGKWVAEEKFDGDRMKLSFINGVVTLYNRRGVVVTHKYPELHSFKADMDCVLDGEVCVIDENGVSQFNEGIAFRSHCENPESIAAAQEKHPITFVVFDVLMVDGDDCKPFPWHDRRKQLENLDIKCDSVIRSKYDYDIMKIWNDVTSKGGEGIILKKIDSRYLEGKRSSVWKKVKDIKEVDIKVVSYTKNPAGIRVESDDGIACQVSGFRAPPVQSALDKDGEATITIRHLGWTGTKYRQPVFAKLVE